MNALAVSVQRRFENALVFFCHSPKSSVDFRIKLKIFARVRRELAKTSLPGRFYQSFLQIFQKILFVKYSSNLDFYVEVAKEIAAREKGEGNTGLSEAAQRFLQALQRVLLRDDEAVSSN